MDKTNIQSQSYPISASDLISSNPSLSLFLNSSAAAVSFRRFSASSSRDPLESTADPSPAAEPSPKSLNAYLLNSIKSSLKEPQTPRNYSSPPPHNSLNFSIPESQSSQSLQQIRQNLAGYRNRTESQPSTAATTPSQPTSLEGIRQSLRGFKPSSPQSVLHRSHKWTPPASTVTSGMNGNALPGNIFGRELNKDGTTPFFSKVYSKLKGKGKVVFLLVFLKTEPPSAQTLWLGRREYNISTTDHECV